MKKILLALFLTLLPSLAFAQSQRNPCYYTGASPGPGNGCIPVSTANPLPVNATVNASVSGFTPNGNFATLTATNASSVSTALPSGVTVAFQNTSNIDVSCVLSSGVATATTNKLVVHGGSTQFFTIGSNINAACINQTGSASNVIVMAGGTGLGTNFAGATTGGGGGGTSSAFDSAFPANGTAIGLSDGTNMQPWLTASFLGDGVNGNNTGAMAQWYWNGTTFDRAPGDATNGAWVNVKTSVLPTGAATSANQATEISSLATIATNSGAPIPYQSPAVPVGGIGICDGANGATNPCTTAATVKAASTPSAATDKALVVDQRPGTGDYCNSANTKLGAVINLTASGQVITGTSAKKTYICAIDVVPSAAQNIALVEGTGTVCATNIFGLAGGTTAATGWNFQLGGGIARGSGTGTVYSPSADTNAAAANVCLLIAGAGQVSGQISYVQQ